MEKDIKKDLNNLKLEVASEIGLSDYDNRDKGQLTSRENGNVGGNMVRVMVNAYERGLRR